MSEHLNHFRCCLCRWNSDVRSKLSAMDIVRRGRLDLVFRVCTSPKIDKEGKKCQGIMVLVAYVGELSE